MHRSINHLLSFTPYSLTLHFRLASEKSEVRWVLYPGIVPSRPATCHCLSGDVTVVQNASALTLPTLSSAALPARSILLPSPPSNLLGPYCCPSPRPSCQSVATLEPSCPLVWSSQLYTCPSALLCIPLAPISLSPPLTPQFSNASRKPLTPSPPPRATRLQAAMNGAER